MRKIKRKIPRYAFGTNGVGSIGGGLNALPFGKSQATTGAEAGAQTVSDIFSGASTGFAVGGPWGALVGAGIGAIGKSGGIQENPGFTTDNSYTRSTGIVGAFNRSAEKRAIARDKQNVRNNRFAVGMTDNILNDYYTGNDYQPNTYTFQMGGSTLPSSYAYVDDGETIQTPDGSIIDVADTGKPVDSNLVDLPDGSRILSDTLKVPGTKTTFSDMAQKLIKKTKTTGTDRYAENSRKLNQMNADTTFNMLYDMQEMTKEAKGLGPETKNNLQEFQTGGQKSYVNPYSGGYNPNGNYRLTNQPIRPEVPRPTAPGYDNPAVFDYMQNSPQMQQVREAAFGDLTASNPFVRTSNISVDPISINVNPYANVGISSGSGRSRSTSVPVGLVNPGVLGTRTPYERYTAPTDVIPTTVDTIGSPTSTRNSIVPSTIAQGPQGSIAQRSTLPDTLTSPVAPQGSNYTPQNNSGNFWNSLMSGVNSIATAAPAIANLFGNSAESIAPNYNPYGEQIRRTMAGRRFDVQPVISSLNNTRAITDYNATNQNTNTGSNLAYRLQSAIATQDAIGDAYSQANIVNNQYAADYANTLNGLGDARVQAENYANDYNARSRANTRNIRNTGLSQVSQLAQQNQLNRNRSQQEQALLPFLQNYLASAYPNEFVDQVMSTINSNRTGIRRPSKR